MMLRNEEFNVLDKLRMYGPLPLELEQRYQKLRRQEFYRAGLKADNYPPSSSHLEDTDMSVSDWLRAKWISADAIVRKPLRLLADALGIPLPLARTRPVSSQDSSPTPVMRRSRSSRHTSHAESDTLAGLGMDPEPSPEDRGWYK